MVYPKVLIVEDDRTSAHILRQALESVGYRVSATSTGEDGLRMLASEEWDLVFLDYILPGCDGLAVMQQLNQMKINQPPVVFMTAHSTVENAVEAMKAGAADYITKPANSETIILKAGKVLEVKALRKRLEGMSESLRHKHDYQNIVANSQAMIRALETVKTVAMSETETILLLGESGVGKNLVAQTIHYNSGRAEAPFMNVLCTALPEQLLESELFGHEKGAFTDARSTRKGLFEQADGGTVFLDEIGELPLGLQAKLLHFLESRTFRRVGGTSEQQVNVRIVAATNRELISEVQAGNFRADLFYRLNVIEIRLPPLRERPADIVPLAERLIDHFNRKFGRGVRGLTREATEALQQSPWPGNVRELKNLLERAMILSRNTYLTPEDFPGLSVGRSIAPSPFALGPEQEIGQLPANALNLVEHEKALIKRALSLTQGNQTRAAQLLGITRNTLIYRLRKFKIGKSMVYVG